MAALLRSGEARRFEITTEPQENPTYKTVKKPFLFEHDLAFITVGFNAILVKIIPRLGVGKTSRYIKINFTREQLIIRLCPASLYRSWRATQSSAIVIIAYRISPLRLKKIPRTWSVSPCRTSVANNRKAEFNEPHITLSPVAALRHPSRHDFQ